MQKQLAHAFARRLIFKAKTLIRLAFKQRLNTRESIEDKEGHKRGDSSVKLLLDEMYAGLKEHFEILGYEAVTVQEVGLQGARDREIVEYAKRNNLILVTQDQKPADLAELVGTKCVLISNALIARIAAEKIREKYPKC